jgi:hypothetical protein
MFSAVVPRHMGLKQSIEMYMYKLMKHNEDSQV